MSVPKELKTVIAEFRAFQLGRRKAMDVEFGDGSVRCFDSSGKIVGNNSGLVKLQHRSEGTELVVGAAHFPCWKITWYSCINNDITFNFNGFPAVSKAILSVEGLKEVNNVIAHIRPPPPLRPLTYEHDGNITSSGSESDGDLGRGRTTGSVANSFESDDPSDGSEN